MIGKTQGGCCSYILSETVPVLDCVGKKGEFPVVCTCLLHGKQKKILVRQRHDTTLCLIKCFGVTEVRLVL